MIETTVYKVELFSKLFNGNGDRRNNYCEKVAYVFDFNHLIEFGYSSN